LRAFLFAGHCSLVSDTDVLGNLCLRAFFFAAQDARGLTGNNLGLKEIEPMKKLAAIILMLLVACTIAFSQDRANDPSGASTGGASDVTAAKAGQPSMDEVLKEVGHSKVAINMMWTLITGFIVMFMQTGFAMVETGLTQAKNAAHTFAMNFMIYPLGMLGF